LVENTFSDGCEGAIAVKRVIAWQIESNHPGCGARYAGKFGVGGSQRLWRICETSALREMTSTEPISIFKNDDF
jgi:hypothetical protein